MKGFVFIGSEEILLRFVVTEVLADLEKAHDITYIVLSSGPLANNDLLETVLAARGRGYLRLPYHPWRVGQWMDLWDLSCLRYRHKSRSFDIRYRVESELNPGKYRRLEKYADENGYASYRQALEKRLGLHPDLVALVKEQRPDFFAIPTTVKEHLLDDSLWVAEAFKIPTALLIANWDGVSNKGYLSRKPTVMGVWGEQTKRHAIDVQDMEEERVLPIGAPQFEYFRSLKGLGRQEARKQLSLPRSGRIILFAGCGTSFDETETLIALDQAIESGLLPPAYIVYRPHPFRMIREHEVNFFDIEWRNVSIDSDKADFYKSQKEGKSNYFRPEDWTGRYSHLATLYQAVDGLVCPLSSLMVDALYFGLPLVGLIYNDGKHLWGPDKRAAMLHWQDMYEIPEFIFCKHKDDLMPSMEKLYQQMGDSKVKESLIKSCLDYIHQDADTYGDMVLSLIDKMMSYAEGPDYERQVNPGKTTTISASIRHSSVLNQARKLKRLVEARISGIRNRVA